MKLTPHQKQWRTIRARNRKNSLASKKRQATIKERIKQTERDNDIPNWGEGDEKREVRNFYVEEEIESKISMSIYEFHRGVLTEKQIEEQIWAGMVLGLETQEFLRAKMMYEAGFTGITNLTCEYGKQKVWDALINNIANDEEAQKYMEKPYRGQIGDKIREAVKNKIEYLEFNGDYCGHYTSFRSEIIMSLEHKIVKVGGLWFLTVCKSREANKKLSKSGDKTLNQVIREEILNKYVDIEGASYRYIKHDEYADVNQDTMEEGNTMYWLLLQRIK